MNPNKQPRSAVNDHQDPRAGFIHQGRQDPVHMDPRRGNLGPAPHVARNDPVVNWYRKAPRSKAV